MAFNPAAAPFKPPPRNDNSYPTINIGPTKIPVNQRIWDVVANNRMFPTFPALSPSLHPAIQAAMLPDNYHQPIFNPINLASNLAFGLNKAFVGYVSSEFIQC